MNFTPDARPVTLMLAGFTAFPGAPKNPAEHLVRHFHGDAVAEGSCIERLILPVEWGRSWAVLEKAIRRARPAAVLLVGLHSRAERFLVETLAFNEREVDRPDAAGRFAPSRSIAAAAPPTIASSLPLVELERSLSSAGTEFELSRDPGRYLCNETLFLLGLHAEYLGVRSYAFLHTPMTEECAAETSGLRPHGGSDQGRKVTASALHATALAMLEHLARETATTAASDTRSRS